MAANCKRRRYFLIVAVGTAFHNSRFSAIQPVLSTAKASASLGMARSSFSASEVCQIVCGDDNDEKFIFPGSDDDLGMNDTDDDDQEGDSDCDEASEMCNTGTRNLSGGDEPGDQVDSLPGPSAAAFADSLEQDAVSSIDGASISSSIAASGKSQAIATSAATPDPVSPRKSLAH